MCPPAGGGGGGGGGIQDCIETLVLKTLFEEYSR
jgi:hypothetical protein